MKPWAYYYKRQILYC